MCFTEPFTESECTDILDPSCTGHLHSQDDKSSRNLPEHAQVECKAIKDNVVTAFYTNLEVDINTGGAYDLLRMV